MLDAFDHVISDPTYEESLHKSKNEIRNRLRTDKGQDLKFLNFAGIGHIRDDIVKIVSEICNGWSILFVDPPKPQPIQEGFDL